jgi:hypothetical protein
LLCCDAPRKRQRFIPRNGTPHCETRWRLNPDLAIGDQSLKSEDLAVGWIFVAVVIASLLAAAIYLVRKGARRWWDYLVIGGLAVALVRPILMIVTGDVSAWLPAGIWSDGPDGKDQIIVASAMATVLLPLALAAGAVCAVHRAIDYSHADRVAS